MYYIYIQQCVFQMSTKHHCLSIILFTDVAYIQFYDFNNPMLYDANVRNPGLYLD